MHFGCHQGRCEFARVFGRNIGHADVDERAVLVRIVRVERPHVSAISSLYEKAKFSGQDVESPDADSAAAAFFAMGKEER